MNINETAVIADIILVVTKSDMPVCVGGGHQSQLGALRVFIKFKGFEIITDV
jgi:arginase family enzyme